MPKISVIMPAYNAEKYIREAVDSILAQTFGDFELIVLNDCSKDGTENILASYDDPRIVYVKNEENLGVARTLNKGLALARGEYIARMDADDISLPDRFEKQTAYLDSHPDCGICGSWVTVFGEGIEDRIAPFAVTHEEILADQLFNPAFAHPAVMLRKSALERSGGYDCACERAEDYELWYRLLQHCEGHNLPRPLLRYRHHGGQVTVEHKGEMQAVALRLHKRMLQDLGADLTPAEEQVFLLLCGGKRDFRGEDYAAFVSGGKKLIAAAGGFSRQLRKVYAALNLAVKQETGCRSQVYFTGKERLYSLYRTLRGTK